MDSYKLSCPRCGQHIEFTAEYCGRRMQCPSCGHQVTFPAILPGRVVSPSQKPAAKAAAKPASASRKFKLNLPNFAAFEHWNLVWQCVVPFLIIIGLLVGAMYVKKNFGNTTPAALPPVQADAGAWQKMTDLTQADENMQDQIRYVTTARAALDYAMRVQRSTPAGEPMQQKYAGEQVALKQSYLAIAQRRFEDAFKRYQDLGGKVNYRAQLPK